MNMACGERWLAVFSELVGAEQVRGDKGMPCRNHIALFDLSGILIYVMDT
jgi:hypothetical protein